MPLAASLSAQMRDRLINHPWPHLPRDQQEAYLQQQAAFQNRAVAAQYGLTTTHEISSGVAVNIVTPRRIAKGAEDAVLLHLHGGGFTSCGGDCSYSEAMPIAGLTGIKTVSVDYTLVPQARYPVAVEQALTVYRRLLAEHKPGRIAIFGSSAGAILTGQVAARLIKEGLPVPAALGIFTGSGDMSAYGDSANLFTLNGFSSENGSGTDILDALAKAYANGNDLKDPLLSPIYSDLSHFPPTLLTSSTRDVLLSGTANFERALHRAGVHTEFAVFDGLYHGFWGTFGTPETDAALARQACFLARHVGALALESCQLRPRT